MRGETARIAVLLTAFAAAATVCAQAANPSDDLTITGSVDRVCVLDNPQVSLGNSTNVGQVAGSTVTIADLSDEQQMTTKATDFDVALSGMCNFNNRLTVSSDRGGLWREPAGFSASGFANGVPYRAVVDWGGGETSLIAGATAEGEIQQTLETDQPAQGDVRLHFHIDQGATNAGAGMPLEAGQYGDTIRVTLGPL